MAEKQEIVQPEQLNFEDDGVYPGSTLPVLLYRAAITVDAQDRASVFERGFAQNDWRNSWRNGVYSFAHYHSTAHEALGVGRVVLPERRDDRRENAFDALHFRDGFVHG